MAVVRAGVLQEDISRGDLSYQIVSRGRVIRHDQIALLNVQYETRLLPSPNLVGELLLFRVCGSHTVDNQFLGHAPWQSATIIEA
jgi:hypothetical protein